MTEFVLISPNGITEMKTDPFLSRSGVGIRLIHLSKQFGPSKRIFSELNLSIEPGEFVSVVGASGCGKSTLLRLLAGLEKADSGAIEFYPAPRPAFVFQEPQLLPWRTVESNVRLPLELGKGLQTNSDEKVTRALQSVGLERERKLFPSQLSGGMKMRVSLARALVSEPTLLLLDEPFAALDELSRVQLEEELRTLWKHKGMTIVLVTHSFSEAVFLSNRVLILDARKQSVGDTLNLDFGDRDESFRQKSAFVDAVHACRKKFEALQKGAA
jgi:NitT/TauT family transport system ATP-binding protein